MRLEKSAYTPATRQKAPYRLAAPATGVSACAIVPATLPVQIVWAVCVPLKLMHSLWRLI